MLSGENELRQGAGRRKTLFKNMKKLSAIFLAVLLGISTMTTVFAEEEIPEDKLLTEEIMESRRDTVTGQSGNVEVKAGETAVFTVSAEGMVRSYQWQVSKDGGKKWKKLDARTDTLNIEAKAEYDGWLYRCAVTFKGLKVVYSEPVALIVKGGAVMTEGCFRDETDEYLITVSFTEEAGIPEGTELFVRRITDNSEEYWDLWNRTLSKLNENATWGSEVIPDTRKGIAAAEFFDVSLLCDGRKVEPAAPLQIEISFKEGGLLQVEGEQSKVIHFHENGTKLTDVAVKGKAVLEGMPDGILADDFVCMEDGLSVIGVFTTDEFIDLETAVPYGTEYLAPAVRALKGPAVRAGETGIAANKTVTDTDNDGIYELALTVTGASEQSQSTEVVKSNVILVIDTSQSMVGNNVYSEYTYSADTYNSNNRYYNGPSSSARRVYYVNGAWRTSNNSSGTVYTGTVYLYETRMAATQRAAIALIDSLLSNNDESDPDLADVIEISIVEFARLQDSGIRIQNVNTAAEQTQANGVINGFSAGSHYGTNWAEGLRLAKVEADRYKTAQPDENVSVIFLTDGMPTYYLNSAGTSQSGTGYETNADNVHNSWNGAAPYARRILVNDNGTPTGYALYGIFSFGGNDGANYLNALMHYANTGSGSYNYSGATEPNFYNAQNTAALEEAFSAIINHINNNVGYAGVNITDGVSLGATNTSVAVGGNVNADSMRYSVHDGSVTLYSVKIADGTATFTIYDGDPATVLTDSSPATVTTTINGEDIVSTVYSVTIGTGDDAKTYKMSPATIDDNGLVKWDLAGLGILENGITYKLAFDVWPNQIAYDIAADLNNGIYQSVDEALIAYDVTDEEEAERVRNALQQNASGAYEVYTNYTQSVEYYEAESHTDEEGNTTWTYGEKKEKDLPKPDPMPLHGSLINLRKAWEADLAIDELNELLWEDGIEGGTSKEYQIKLYVWRADTEAELDTLVHEHDISKAYIKETLGWDAAKQEYIFDKDIAVAPGMMVNLAEAESLGFDTTSAEGRARIRTFTDGDTTTQYYVVESGHYYYVTEEGADLHFELETVLYHPMVVDGNLCNVFFGPDQTVARMDMMYEVVATNALKGGLDIMKKVYGGDYLEEGAEPVDSTAEFAYEIKIWKEDENGNKVPVYTTENELDDNGEMLGGALGWRIYDEDMNELEEGGRGPILATTEENANPRIVIGAQETTITVAIPANQIFYLANVSGGTHYTVTEIQDEAAVYKHFKTTLSETKDFETYTDKPSVELEPGAYELSDHSITDVIQSNTSDIVTFHNGAPTYFYVYHSSNKEVEKISFLDERVKGTFDTETGKYVYEFDIVNETAAGYLYGGYYKVFSGAGVTDAQLNETSTDDEKPAVTYTEDTATGKFWYEDTAGTAYDATKANVWKGANAYTGTVETTGGGIGTAMTPRPGVVYYLKEVPNGYIRPYIHFTYDDRDPAKPLKKLYVITAADDVNYSLVGYILGDATTGTAATSRSLAVTIKKPDGTIDATLTAKSVFKAEQMAKYTDKDGSNPVALSRGYLHITEFTSSIGTEFTFQPCWNTLDGVLVKGLTVRTVNGGTNYLDGDADCIGVTDVAAP